MISNGVLLSAVDFLTTRWRHWTRVKRFTNTFMKQLCVGGELCQKRRYYAVPRPLSNRTTECVMKRGVSEEEGSPSVNAQPSVKEPEGQRQAACNRTPRAENVLQITSRLVELNACFSVTHHAVLSRIDASMHLSSQGKMERCMVPVAFLSFAMMLDAQMVCWQALMRCHEERDCELAYNQYLAACDGIIRGSRRQCPSHCISALIRLNQTANGPFLETCDCGMDPECLRAKRAVEPCLPRTHPGDADGIGCTEARQRCEDEPGCQSSLTAYLSHCGQLFNGRKCSSRCKSTIEELLFMPSGALLNQCVCDGLERPFCEVVKQNMVKLCSMGDHGVSAEHDGTDDAYEDEDYEAKPTDADAVMSFAGAPARTRHVVLLCIAFALAFTL